MSQLPRGLSRHRRPRNTADPRISIVVPALNEALNLAAVLPLLPEVHEVILVDGGSVDGTVQAARRALPDIITVLQGRRARATRWPRVRPGDRRHRRDVRRRRLGRPGGDPRVRRRAQGRRRLRQGLALHRGRRLVDITPAAHFGNRFLNALFNVLFRTRYTDLCYGYNAFWADLIPLLDLPDHAPPAPATAPCCGVTGSRSRPSSTAASPPRAWRSPRCPRSRSCGSSASPTSVPSPTVSGSSDPVHRVAPGPVDPQARASVSTSPSSPRRGAPVGKRVRTTPRRLTRRVTPSGGPPSQLPPTATPAEPLTSGRSPDPGGVDRHGDRRDSAGVVSVRESSHLHLGSPSRRPSGLPVQQLVFSTARSRRQRCPAAAPAAGQASLMNA